MILVVWIQDVGGFDIINFEIRISKSATNLIMRDMIVKLYRVFIIETLRYIESY